MLELVSLDQTEAKRRLRNYSLGMKQRLGIAHALLGDPSVLILDEPANGLDPAGIRWMRGLLKSYADRGGTVLLSSHLLNEVEQIADEMILIGRGKIVAQRHQGRAARRRRAQVRLRHRARQRPAHQGAAGQGLRRRAGRHRPARRDPARRGRPGRGRAGHRAHRPACRRRWARGASSSRSPRTRSATSSRRPPRATAAAEGPQA